MVAVSVIDRTYLAEARVLARSVLAHHPECRVLVLVVDAADAGEGDGEPFELLTPADVGLEPREVARRAALYEPQALVSSLKPALMRHALARGAGPVLLFDADILVLGGLEPLAGPAREHAVVLTPHDPEPAVHVPGGHGTEQTFLRAGVFNGGVLACGPGAEPFLDWWAARTARDCLVDDDRALVMSQAWLTLVPALFDHHVVRHRGVNATGHNLRGDDVDWSDPAAPTVAGAPLLVHHFAGKFDAHRPLALYDGAASNPWWPDAAAQPGLAQLCERYAALLLAAGHDQEHAHRRTLDVVGPVPLDAAMRHAYRTALLAAEAAGAPEPPAPLADGADAFLAWLAAASRPGSPVSRWLAALRDLRADLQAAFPHVPGSDDLPLVAWAATKGPSGPYGLPLAAVGS